MAFRFSITKSFLESLNGKELSLVYAGQSNVRSPQIQMSYGDAYYSDAYYSDAYYSDTYYSDNSAGSYSDSAC